MEDTKRRLVERLLTPLDWLMIYQSAGGSVSWNAFTFFAVLAAGCAGTLLLPYSSFLNALGRPSILSPWVTMSSGLLGGVIALLAIRYWNRDNRAVIRTTAYSMVLLIAILAAGVNMIAVGVKIASSFSPLSYLLATALLLAFSARAVVVSWHVLKEKLRL